MIRRRLAAVLAALVLACTGLVATAPAAEAVSLGCRYERGGSSWSGGEWVRLFCNGSYFNKPGSRYRVYVICDRLGWQANVVRYGSWTTKGGYSTRACSAIGERRVGVVGRSCRGQPGRQARVSLDSAGCCAWAHRIGREGRRGHLGA